MISQYFNQINLLSYRGKKFSSCLVFELIKKYNKHLERNKSKLGEIIKSKLIYEWFYKSNFNRYSYIWILVDFCMNINEVKTKYSQLIKDINFDCLDLEHKTELL